MNRSAVGVIALVLALVGVVGVRAVENPGIPGTAGAAPLPGPPAVGSCLLLVDGLPTPVHCAAPHDLEITAGVTADATPPTRSQCDAAAAAYLPPVFADDWQVPVDVETDIVPAPPGQGAADRGWQACTVRPGTHDRFSGSIRGMTASTFRTDVFGSCFDSAPGPRVPCADAHAYELLGTADFVYPDAQQDGTYFGIDYSAAALPDAVHADLDQRCASLAAALADTADPTYGAQLTLRMDVGTVVPTDVPGSIRAYVTCQVMAPGRSLTASVIGLGAGPPPFG